MSTEMVKEGLKVAVRKKARRACIACRRAHLTCGDERPCQRCIKRGSTAACQDTVKKKAKYYSNNEHATTNTSNSNFYTNNSPFYHTPLANPLHLRAMPRQPEAFNVDPPGLDSVALGFGMETSSGMFDNSVGIFSVPRQSAPNSATQEEARQALLTLLSFFQFQPGYVNQNNYFIIVKWLQDLTPNQSHDPLLEAPSRIKSPQSDLLTSKMEQS